MKNKKCKFKYLSFRYEHNADDLSKDFSKCIIPPELIWNNLPDGEYLLRGKQKGHRSDYWKCQGIWFLISTSKWDNGHSIVDVVNYDLFPNLSERQWSQILNINPRYLNKHWQKMYHARKHYYEIKNILREASMSRHLMLKDFKDESDV